MSKAKKKYTAEDLVNRIRGKYSDGQRFGVMEQVAAGTGAGANSWIDCAVVSLWPSDGLWRAAFEGKVLRADLLNELRNPTKNAWCREVFHEFWYVVPPGICQRDEIPTDAGLMVTHGAGLSIRKQAPRNADATMSDSFVCSLVRSAIGAKKQHAYATERKILEASPEYQRAKAVEKGTERFFAERGEWLRWDSADGVFDALCECSRDAEQKRVRDQVVAFLSQVQDRSTTLLFLFAQLAGAALDETDAAGAFIAERYGMGGSETTRDALLARVKARGAKWSKQRDKEKLAQLETARRLISEVCSWNGAAAPEQGEGGNHAVR